MHSSAFSNGKHHHQSEAEEFGLTRTSKQHFDSTSTLILLKYLQEKQCKLFETTSLRGRVNSTEQ